MHLQYSPASRLQNIEGFAKRVTGQDDPALRLTLPQTYFSVHPMVLAATAAAGLRSIKAGYPVQADEIPDNRATRYWERMGLFKMLKMDSGLAVSSREEAGRFVPLREIRSGQQLTGFINDLPPLLHAENHSQAEPIQYVLSELVRNTLEHAGFGASAVVAAQVYPKTGIIGLGVADCGAGIRKSLGASHETKDDLDAVQLAMQPGITGKTSRRGGTADNAGAGLFFCKAMAHTSRNYMVVHSGSGLFKLKIARSDDDALRLYGNPAYDHATRYSGMPAWPGTMVGIDIDVTNFVEFRAVLNFIRKSYNVDVKSADRGKMKKQPRFK